jgi:glycosyltransferase involved in cell wall biosynthesis
VSGSQHKILHVNDYPADGGGAEIIMARTAALQRAAGHEVTIVSATDLDQGPASVFRYVHNPVSRRQLALQLEFIRPDIVHLHNIYHVLSPSILIALKEYKHRRGCRVVMTAHDFHLICPNSGGSWYTVRSRRRQTCDPYRLRHWPYLLSRQWDHRGPVHSLLKLIQHIWNYRWHDSRDVLDAIIAPSRFLQKAFAAAGLQTIHLPHPAPPPQPPPTRPHDPLRLIFVGRVEPEKGLAEFLKILPQTFDALLTVVGAGGDMDRCLRICKERALTDRVVFLGRQQHAAVLRLMAQSHVLVLPSVVPESYGLCLIEALSVGTNLLVTHRGAAGELVAASGVGHVFRARHADSLEHQLALITQKHTVKTLNGFDVSEFLHQRGEAAYLRNLLDIYQEKKAA